MSNGGTVVIGAGPAGLATAAELTRRGVPSIVLERADAVGAHRGAVATTGCA